MDSNAAAKLQLPPPHAAVAAADELPAPAPPEGSGRQRTLTGTCLRVFAALALCCDYLSIVSQNLMDMSRSDEGKPLQLWRAPALPTLAYAVVGVLIWLIGRLERRRRRRLQAADDDDRDDARWEGRVKLAADLLVHANIGLLTAKSSIVTPLAFFVFMRVKSGDQVYIKVQEEEEESGQEKLKY